MNVVSTAPAAARTTASIAAPAQDVIYIAQALHRAAICAGSAATLSRHAAGNASDDEAHRRSLPKHPRRSDESQASQQLSTPLPPAFLTAEAAAIGTRDLVSDSRPC
jgi:hypothetical protein